MRKKGAHMSDFIEEKKQLRKEMLQRLKALPPEQAREESRAAAEALFSLPEWGPAETVLVFVPIGRQREIQTAEVIRRAADEGKELALPRMRGDELEFRRVARSTAGGFDPPLESHPYGVQEPPETAPLFRPAEGSATLVVTPGLAFDRAGGRLGRGKGYYDGWLNRHRTARKSGSLTPVAFGYSFQLIERVPMDEGDVFLPRLVLGGEVIDCGT